MCLCVIQILLPDSVRAGDEQRVFVSNEYFTFGSPDYFTVAIQLADLDRDGDLDLVVCNLGEPAGLYRNRGTSGRRVLVRLRGVVSNRFGIGCTLRLRSASGLQIRQLTLARGYMSSNEPLVHFGLGKDSIIESLRVDWPSGHTQTFENLQPGRFYTVTEPGGAVQIPKKPPPGCRPRMR